MKNKYIAYTIILAVTFSIGFLSVSANGQNVTQKKTKEQKDKEYWCKKATAYREKIEKAQAEIKEAEKRLSETEGTDLLDAKKKKGIKKSQKDLTRAKKQLKEAERELNKLEDEAHRKGIPPGWLRCQFTW